MCHREHGWYPKWQSLVKFLNYREYIVWPEQCINFNRITIDFVMAESMFKKIWHMYRPHRKSIYKNEPNNLYVTVLAKTHIVHISMHIEKKKILRISEITHLQKDFTRFYVASNQWRKLQLNKKSYHLSRLHGLIWRIQKSFFRCCSPKEKVSLAFVYNPIDISKIMAIFGKTFFIHKCTIFFRVFL